MRQLVLVRHGVTDWNVEGRIQGQGGVGLSDQGHEQAKLTAEWLAESYPDARLYSSDLERCRETVAPLAELMGAGVTYHRELRERDFGDWTGHTHTEVERRWPAAWAAWCAGQDVATAIGGEPTEALAERVEAFARHALGELLDEEIAVLVSHGGSIWHGVHRLVGLPHGSLGGVGNASVTVLHAYDHALQLSLWNQVGHLPPALRTWFRAARGDSARSAADDSGSDGQGRNG